MANRHRTAANCSTPPAAATGLSPPLVAVVAVAVCRSALASGLPTASARERRQRRQNQLRRGRSTCRTAHRVEANPRRSVARQPRFLLRSEHRTGPIWPAMKRKYEVFIPHCTSSADVYRVIRWMLSELAVGHWLHHEFRRACIREEARTRRVTRRGLRTGRRPLHSSRKSTVV